MGKYGTLVLVEASKNLETNLTNNRSVTEEDPVGIHSSRRNSMSALCLLMYISRNPLLPSLPSLPFLAAYPLTSTQQLTIHKEATRTFSLVLVAVWEFSRLCKPRHPALSIRAHFHYIPRSRIQLQVSHCARCFILRFFSPTALRAFSYQNGGFQQHGKPHGFEFSLCDQRYG